MMVSKSSEYEQSFIVSLCLLYLNERRKEVFRLATVQLSEMSRETTESERLRLAYTFCCNCSLQYKLSAFLCTKTMLQVSVITRKDFSCQVCFPSVNNFFVDTGICNYMYFIQMLVTMQIYFQHKKSIMTQVSNTTLIYM